MDLQPKALRKRVADFTGEEKALLAKFIKNRPIVKSKLTDGKSVAKKQAAWDLIAQEFNYNANVHKVGLLTVIDEIEYVLRMSETITLKRAGDNMKAFTRKARATERVYLFRTAGGLHAPPPQPQHGVIISMVEDGIS